MPGGRKNTHADKVAGATRRASCVRLRILGLTYEEIGKREGISGVAAYKHVKRGLELAAKMFAENIEGVREQELRRLDRALVFVNTAMQKGDLSAVDRLIKIQERRARYLGLDAPERYEHAGAGGGPLLAPVILLPPEDPHDEEPPALERRDPPQLEASTVIPITSANGHRR